ncbi:hypothetical protein [Pontixanthobacter sp. CEM42]|uniref:hypothetical protein n=1 Tax=Pontixanthobacter sp. CEM42 TaxID=2792077 RepID=UPI001ADF989D|nr:hypothetical protein [Pontixanthobacter sp. CEM42]
MSEPKPKKYTGLMLALAAAATVIIGGAVFGLVQQASFDREARDQIAVHSDYAQQRYLVVCDGAVAADEAACIEEASAEARSALREQERAELDLVAQQKMALWTAVMGIAAMIGMGLSALGIWLVWTTFRETRRQARIAEDNLESFRATERGYCEIELSGGTASKTSDVLDFSAKITNTGRSTVKVLAIRYRPLAEPKSPLDDEFGGATLKEFNVEPNEKSKPSHLVRGTQNIKRFPYIGGYVEYRCKFGQLHKTYFCYFVDLRKNDSGLVATHFTHFVADCLRERDWPPNS